MVRRINGLLRHRQAKALPRIIPPPISLVLTSLPMPPLSEWQALFAVQAGAAATLTGLVFVAVSINLARILEVPGLSGRAAESILHFLQVFFVCTAMLIPRQPMAAIGLEILALALLSWAMQVTAQIRYARSRSGHPRIWLIMRIVQTQLAGIPFIVAALLLLQGWPAGVFWLVLGFVFSFISGVANAWVLLIEILR
jgi:hypothetical protein